MDIVEKLRQEIGGYTDVHLEKAEADMREAADEIEQLRDELDTWMSVFPDIAPESVLPDRSNLEKEIERLRKRVELLEGYLNGALNVIEGFVHCDTTEARKALKEKE